MRLGGTQCRSGRCAEAKILAVPAIKPGDDMTSFSVVTAATNIHKQFSRINTAVSILEGSKLHETDSFLKS
jgi:hypothetical protein